MRLGSNHSPHIFNITRLHSTHLCSIIAEDATAPDLVLLLENESQPLARHGKHNVDAKFVTERDNLLHSIVDAPCRKEGRGREGGREGENMARREGGREGKGEREKRKNGRRAIVFTCP